MLPKSSLGSLRGRKGDRRSVTVAEDRGMWPGAEGAGGSRR